MRMQKDFLHSTTPANLIESTHDPTKTLLLLTVSNIHRGVQIDYKRVVKIFFEQQPRKLNISNLIFDEE